MKIHIRYITYSILSLLFFASCNQGSNMQNGERSANDTIAYVITTVYEQEANCDTNKQECTHIKLRYPVLVAPEHQTLNDSLTFQIKKWLVGKTDLSEKEFCKNFIADYNEFRAGFSENTSKWFINREIRFINNSPYLITLHLSEENYVGGAHGMWSDIFINYNPLTGKEINLGNLVNAGKMDEVYKVGEKRFRTLKKIPEGKPLKEVGYFYMDDTKNGENPFFLSDNFAITKDGLLFYYNPYEIAPYANGATILKIPFSDLKGLLTDDGVLKGLINLE